VKKLGKLAAAGQKTLAHFNITAPASSLALLWTGFFLVVVGARLILVARYGSSLAMYDQWDGEGSMLLKPWREGTLRLTDLFTPHNEHRMAPSKLLALGLVWLNGQWDARLQMTVTTILCGLIAVVFAWTAARCLERRFDLAVLVVIACWSSFPYAWENTTWGFQSSFYMLIFFSWLAIWGLGLNKAYSVNWFIGLVAALIAGVSMGSGLLSMGVVIALEAVRAVKSRQLAADRIVTVVICGAVLALFAHYRVDMTGLEPFKTNSFPNWWNSFSQSLSWPFPTTWGWVGVYLPLFVFLFWYFRPRNRSEPPFQAADTFLALNGWVVLQAGALAYARGVQNVGGIPSRYGDMLALGAAANCIAVLWWLARNNLRRPLRLVAAGFAVLWVAALLTGTIKLSWRELGPAAEKARVARLAERSARAYVATGDRKVLFTFPPWHLPYPWLEPLAQKLDDPAIRGILPSAVAAPLVLKPEPGSAGFKRDAIPGGLGWPGEQAWRSGPNESFRSEVIHPRLAYLRFEVYGSLNSRMSLDLQDEQTGQLKRWARETELGGRFIRYVAAGDAGVRVIARDQSSDGSFAFADPRETGRFSFYAEVLLGKSRTVLGFGVALMLASTVMSLFGRTRPIAS
jgi:hypothetical protein